MPTATANKEPAELALRGESPFAIATMEPATLREVIAANLGGGGFTAQELDRVKVPGSGGTTWTIPGLEGPAETKTLSGIIVAWKFRKAYWEKSMEEGGGGSPPDCHSEDGLIGLGNPGGSCKRCPFNQFGTAKKGQGEGKACKDIIQLFMVREDDRLPLVVSAPASSIQNVRQYLRRLAGQGLIFYGAVTTLRLQQERSNGGIVYSEITPTLERRLSPPELASAKAFSEAINALLAKVSLEQGDVEPFSD